MKIGIIGDLHIGINAEIPEFISYQEERLEKAISSLQEMGCKDIVFLGDLTDDRKEISWLTLNFLRGKKFFDRDINFHMLVGNHDCYYKNTNEINSLRELYSDKENIHIIDMNPVEINDCLFIPWINKENYDQMIDAIKNSTAKNLFGHFDIAGAVMVGGIESKSGLPRELFKKFDHVFSGHFHIQQTIGSILYVGSLCELNWSDFNLKKSFFLLSEGEVEKFDFDNTIYKKILIDTENSLDDILEYEKKFLKIYINRKLTKAEEKNLEKVIENSLRHEIIDNTMLLENNEVEIVDEEFSDITREFILTYKDIDDSIKDEALNLIMKSYDEIIKGEI